MIGVGSLARARREGGQSPAVAGPRRCSPPMQGPRRSIDIAGGGKTETPQNSLGRGLQEERDRGSAMANRPLDDRRGNCQPLPPHQMPLDNRWMSRVGWARKTVGRCRFDVDFSYIYHGLCGSASPVLTATGFVNGRWQFSTPHRIHSPWPITKKFVASDYVGDPYGCAKFGANPSTGGFWANGWNITKIFFIHLFIPFFINSPTG